jgi:hypothetical protein
MSSNLSWQPPPSAREVHYIGLKYEIGTYYEEDYNGGNLNVMADSDLIPFLKGIIAVGSPDDKKDAKELISAIEKYGSIELNIV